VAAGPTASGWAGNGGAWRARQAACLQASDQKRRRPEGMNDVEHQAQVTIDLIVTLS